MSDSAVALVEADAPPERVVYLLGAGATQGCVDYRSNAHKLMMRDLSPELTEEMRALIPDDDVRMLQFINEVVTDTTDFEQLITFLEDAPSERHRTLAAGLKRVFAHVLRTRLRSVVDDLGEDHSFLYAALVDMHEVAGTGETLAGFLTLNYDVFLDHAIETRHSLAVDHGVGTTTPESDARSIPVLKLHGSFGWHSRWPIEVATEGDGELWIPPGIRKAKADYPFNLVWGKARQLLDCDVLRIIGCNLNPNDWDLVSLLFTTKHAHAGRGPYRIEVISRPRTAAKVAALFPYLDVVSILELPDVGPGLIGELLAREPASMDDLTEGERELAVQQANDSATMANSFERWMRQKGEAMLADGMSLDTDSGIFKSFIEPEDGDGL